MAKILIVDDDRELIESVKAVLETQQHQVVVAHDGVEGVAAAKREKPDLMLLDVMMTTDSEGFDVAKRMHADAETRAIPVIMLTGIRRAKNLPFTFEPDPDWLPVKAVLEKPLRPELRLKHVNAALGRS
jgi:two-component system alkaline phosphatase synthesis response regulator PhoP